MISIPSSAVKSLKEFLGQNSDIDLRSTDLLTIEKSETLVTRIRKSTTDQEGLIEALRAFQRLMRILTPGNANNSRIALALLEKNIHSALQIAAYPRAQFLALWQSIIPEGLGTVADAQALYANAVLRKCLVAVQYMQQLQDNEPHVLAARV